MNVFLHTRTAGVDPPDWNNTDQTFRQVPHVGEYVALDGSNTWFKVEFVVHLPKNPIFQYDAEVYAVAVDHVEEVTRLLHT